MLDRREALRLMGFVGKEPVITPNLDGLAKESLVLTDAVSNYPLSNGVHCNCFVDGRDLPDGHVW